MRRWLPVLALLFALIPACPAFAQGPVPGGPDYAVPGAFSMPWDCGQGYRVTWEPPSHWEYGKASGIAWDFAMPSGSMVTAPFSGTAYFRSDLRPLDTTYGHYVEIVDATGQWLVRLAHLLEPQSGTRFVREGEPIGYSGASGVPAAHLHLELLVRDGMAWVRPDLASLTSVYGTPVQALVEGATIVRAGCQSPIEAGGPVQALRGEVALGEQAELAVPLYNVSPDPVDLDSVQLALFSLDGRHAVAEATGPWHLEGGDVLEVTVSALLPAPGEWYVGRLTYLAGDRASGFPARGGVVVRGAPLRLVELAAPQEGTVGERTAFDVRVENTSGAGLTVDDLVLEGRRPDGVPWQAVAPGALYLAPGAVQAVTLTLPAPLQRVGYWTLERLSYVQGGNRLAFAEVRADLAVRGPQFDVVDLALYHSNDRAVVLMRVDNTGTEAAAVDAFVVWGWKPSGEAFEVRQGDPAVIEPGQSALVSLTVPLEAVEGTWRFAEAGYWLRGNYTAMPLPGAPAVEATGIEAADNEPAGVPVPVGPADRDDSGWLADPVHRLK